MKAPDGFKSIIVLLLIVAATLTESCGNEKKEITQNKPNVDLSLLAELGGKVEGTNRFMAVDVYFDDTKIYKTRLGNHDGKHPDDSIDTTNSLEIKIGAIIGTTKIRVVCYCQRQREEKRIIISGDLVKVVADCDYNDSLTLVLESTTKEMMERKGFDPGIEL